MARLAPLALLALAACRDDPQAALLEGAWFCASEPPDYALERQVTFAPDGRLSGRTEVQTTDAETALDMHFAFSGTWELADGLLAERIETHRLMRFARAGTNVPLAELPAGVLGEIEGALARQSAAYRVETLTAEELVLRDTAEAVQTVCERSQGG
ncbi:hypothetical protein [Vannielia litorea]|uniref:hypothetical protein n=1 Tax=Vannielia litorea TaxID=1217970 RepID=UPI0009406FE5|nr:hypothetical protein [Vannielia litorea]